MALLDRRPPTRTVPTPPLSTPLQCSTTSSSPAPFGPSRATRSPPDREIDAEQRLVAVGVRVGEAVDPEDRGVAVDQDHAATTAMRAPSAGSEKRRTQSLVGTCTRSVVTSPPYPRDAIARYTRSPRRADDDFAYFIHALPAQCEHLVERRVGLGVDAPASRTGEPRSSQAPRVVRVGDPLHHPPQPAVRDQHEVTVRLDEAPLALDLLVEDRFGQLPRPGDSPSPAVFDHRPGVSQALRVCRPQLVALGPQRTRLGIATFHL